MSIQQTKKTSDLEKRLRLLRQQVHGREQFNAESPKYKLEDKFSSTNQSTKDSVSDVAYLKQDLLKIVILSTLALGSQIILFFLIKNSIINLNFF